MRAFKRICNAIIKAVNNCLPSKRRIPRIITGDAYRQIPKHVNCRCVIVPLPFIYDEKAGDAVE